jgi:DME family drug/metabolite transporter
VVSPAGIVLALWLGLAATSLAYILFGLGLPVLQPGHIATLTLLEPVGATILGVVVLGETVTVAGWLGVGLVLAGLAVVGLRDRA